MHMALPMPLHRKLAQLGVDEAAIAALPQQRCALLPDIPSVGGHSMSPCRPQNHRFPPPPHLTNSRSPCPRRLRLAAGCSPSPPWTGLRLEMRLGRFLLCTVVNTDTTTGALKLQLYATGISETLRFTLLGKCDSLLKSSMSSVSFGWLEQLNLYFLKMQIESKFEKSSFRTNHGSRRWRSALRSPLDSTMRLLLEGRVARLLLEGRVAYSKEPVFQYCCLYCRPRFFSRARQVSW